VKFTDGYWQLRPGVTPAYPSQVAELSTSDGEVAVTATTYPVQHRGDLLKGPALEYRFDAPAPDVIRVRIAHFAGRERRGPVFELTPEPGTPSVSIEDGAAVLTSGALSVRVSRDGWGIEFSAGGRVLTRSGHRHSALMSTPDGQFLREQLSLGPGEHVYGLGERFGPLVRNGQSVDVWNADAGTSSEQAYKNVPFYLTDAGYGVLVNHPGKVSFEIGSEAVSRIQFSVADQELEYLLIHGPTPKQILARYTALTGRPALPPAWSFGLWLSTSFTTSYDEATVTSFVDGMAARDLPLSVFHFDCFWMRELHWCDFEWDPRVFPDPVGMLSRLKARGLRICLWINPYIAQRSALFEEGRQAGFLLRTTEGDVWQSDQWQPGMGLVDFTNPAAREWYASKLDTLLEQGVDCFKSDFGERIPVQGVTWFDGSDPERMHNYYAFLYNQTVFEALRKRRGEGAVVFARSATTGGQQFPVHWGGDCEATFPSMAESLRGGLSLGLSGFGYWSHDIGGFEGTPDPELFKRWVAFGLLSSHSRLHGSGSYRVPWAFDDEAVDVLREFTALKMRLMPYLYEVARQAHTDGVPMMRAMVLEFPGDPGCAYLDRQYMLGPDLLVAPVFEPGGEVTYYVPAGVWTHLLSGRTVTGPAWVTETHDVHSLPLLVRPGAVLPTGPVRDRPDYDYAAGVTLTPYQLADGDRVVTTIPNPAGEAAARYVSTCDGGVVRTVEDR
jgi:alpha-D-xyloside xylohydrolase